MGIVVDLIIIAVVVLSTFLAYKKGLVKLAIGLCAFVISIIITVVLYQPISNLVINVTGIDEMIEDAIYEKANDVIKEDTKEGTKEEKLTNQLVETAKNEMLPDASRELAINIVRGGVMIVLFIGSKITLRFITVLADAIAKLPIIDQINKTSGMIYGIIRGILIIYVSLLVLGIPAQINPNNQINFAVQQSLLGKTMYENNILTIFF